MTIASKCVMCLGLLLFGLGMYVERLKRVKKKKIKNYKSDKEKKIKNFVYSKNDHQKKKKI